MPWLRATGELRSSSDADNTNDKIIIILAGLVDEVEIKKPLASTLKRPYLDIQKRFVVETHTNKKRTIEIYRSRRVTGAQTHHKSNDIRNRN